MRTLTLRKEHLTELTTDELAVVVGAAATRICLTDPCITPHTGLQCLTETCD